MRFSLLFPAFVASLSFRYLSSSFSFERAQNIMHRKLPNKMGSFSILDVQSRHK